MYSYLDIDFAQIGYRSLVPIALAAAACKSFTAFLKRASGALCFPTQPDSAARARRASPKVNSADAQLEP